MKSEVKNVKVNESIVSTYSYLRGNFSEESFKSSECNTSEFIIDGNAKYDFNNSLSEEKINEICQSINKGVDTYQTKSFLHGKFVNIDFEDESTIDIKNVLKGEVSTSVFNINGNKENSNLYFYSEVLGEDGQFNYLYNINLTNSSKATLVIFLKSKSKGFINICGNCEGTSDIKVFIINLNKDNVYVNSMLNLKGEGSSSDIDVCYICPSKCKFDYNLTLSMIGKESKGEIKGKGVLLDGSHKVFRGAIDFKKGCVNSKGHESEEVIILGKRVKNQSLPLLLCNEKNVEGSHGFSANSIDEDKLFYLRSRGFNEKQAKALILRGKFLNLLSKINREDIADEFLNLLMEAI